MAKKATQAYLPEDEYANQYYQAQKQQRLFHLPYKEFERLASNKIRDDIAPNMPQVNDGSLAGLVREAPMRILAQNFSGAFKVVSSIDPDTKQPATPQPWLAELINTVWEKEIVPNANTQAPFLNKMQLALYRSLIYGSQPIFNFFTKRDGKRIADFTLPYIRDVYLEVGKSSDLDSDYIFMDTWYTPLQVKKIIAAANDVEEIGVKSSWDIPALQEILNNHMEQTKDYLNKNQAERNRPVMADYFKFTTVFQRGVNAPFDTFYSGAGIGGNMGPTKIVRHKINEDPTGDIPIHFLYAYEDLVNPYGVGQMEISGGTQNVLDYLTQLHVLANQIGLQPPILVEGDRSLTDLDSMIYSPSQFWFTGGAKVDVMETSSSILKEFPTAYNLYKSQLANAQQTSTIDIPTATGDPTQGKTPQAIQRNQDREGSHDNYLRQQTVQTFSRVFKSMMNIYLANMQGKDVMRLAMEDAVRLTRTGLIPADAKGHPSTKEIEIDWSKIEGHVDILLDPDSSRVIDTQERVAQLQEILGLIQQNPYLLQYIQATGYELNLGELYADLITSIGIQDSQKIISPMSEEDKEFTENVPPMVFDKPSISLKYSDMPAAAQVQLLQKVGLNVSMEDVLAGPVLDPNIRGVFQPQIQPGQVNNPSPQPPEQDQQTGQPLPAAPENTYSFLPSSGRFAPNVNLQDGEQIQSIIDEKGVPASVAQGVLHARALGLPENEIDRWIANNVSPQQAGAQGGAVVNGQ